MRDYETINEILEEPANVGLTQYQVFKSLFVEVGRTYKFPLREVDLLEAYHSFIRDVNSQSQKPEASRFTTLQLWRHHQQTLFDKITPYHKENGGDPVRKIFKELGYGRKR